MRSKRYAIEDLRQAIDCLPVQTRAAMLEGIRANDIIVGAYTDRDGGVCPMLAAHRCGGRTSLISFARSWDRFANTKRVRHATERELRILTAHLEASLLTEHLPELERVVLDHRERFERNAAEHGTIRRNGNGHGNGNGNGNGHRNGGRAGDPDRSRELRGRPGWAWVVPLRRYDDYQRALERVESERDRLAAEARREKSPA